MIDECLWRNWRTGECTKCFGDAGLNIQPTLCDQSTRLPPSPSGSEVEVFRLRAALAEAERERDAHAKSANHWMEKAHEQQERAQRAEVDLAAARETIRKLRSADNMTCVWHIADDFLERTATAAHAIKAES